LIALGVSLIVLGAIVSWYVVTMVKDTVTVVAALTDIPRGGQIERADLTTVEIRPDPLLRIIPATEITDLVGQWAAADISAGVIVAPQAISDELPPVAGQAIVGVALAANQRPATPPRLGQPITLVAVPDDRTDSVATQTTTQIQAVAWAVTEVSETRLIVIDVTVAKEEAATVARWAAQNRIAAYWDAE
jgi:hypothetical protein